MIERINFWGIPESWHLPAYLVLMTAGVVMLLRFYQRSLRWNRIGRRQRLEGPLLERLMRLWRYALLQLRTLSETYPGLMHAAIAWSFLIFFLGTALATIDADLIKILRGPWYLGFKVVLDVFSLVAIIGLMMAIYRRLVSRPPRLTLSQAFLGTLFLLLLIVLSGLASSSLRLAALTLDPQLQPGWSPSMGWWTPLAWITAQLWLAGGIGLPGLLSLHLYLWLAHALLVMLALVSLPVGKLLHALSSPLNIYLADAEGPRESLAPAHQLGEGQIGARHLEDFTWRQLLYADACTECGRCQDQCPAYNAGAPLSPKELLLSLRAALDQHEHSRSAVGNGSSPFTGVAVSEPAIWACTTCGACVQACPVLIDHLELIVEMRRYLLGQAVHAEPLMNALTSLRRYGNSFGKSDRQRAGWTRGLDFKIKDLRREAAETLWFVGDYASYHPSLASATAAAARVMQRAGIDFGILYDAERSAGNDLRRVGEEGLFELLQMKNSSVLKKVSFQQIVSTDPHSLNTLCGEYSLDRPQTPIYHLTQLIAEALKEGRLAVSLPLDSKVTYQDPCYLGRYQGIYEAPREILQGLGCQLVEMPRSRQQAVCCGAGGGRIWMEELEGGERPCESRLREAAALEGVDTFVVACPKDLTMYLDAMKTVGLDKQLRVVEIMTLVDEATRPG